MTFRPKAGSRAANHSSGHGPPTRVRDLTQPERDNGLAGDQLGVICRRWPALDQWLPVKGYRFAADEHRMGRDQPDNGTCAGL
jgi:hypothetical protein